MQPAMSYISRFSNTLCPALPQFQISIIRTRCLHMQGTFLVPAAAEPAGVHTQKSSIYSREGKFDSHSHISIQVLATELRIG